MATVSFSKEMKFNEKETKALFNFISSKNNCSYKVNTPPAKKASKEDLKKIFDKKK